MYSSDTQLEPDPRELDMLDWLSLWYESQCDGHWERDHGPSITTIANPGWAVKIALGGTDCDGRNLDPVVYRATGSEAWRTCWTENNEFHGAGSPRQLGEILGEFRRWATMAG